MVNLQITHLGEAVEGLHAGRVTFLLLRHPRTHRRPVVLTGYEDPINGSLKAWIIELRWNAHGAGQV